MAIRRMAPAERLRKSRWALALAGAAAFAHQAHAGSFQFGESTDVEYKLTLNYSMGMRVTDPDKRLINGPVDRLQGNVLITDPLYTRVVVQDILANPANAPNEQLIGFTHTGLPDTMNFDDGNRNFHKWDLYNNRLTAFGEVHLTHDNYGLFASGSAFYDQVFNQENSNDSPNTLNRYNATRTGPDVEHHQEFSDKAVAVNGRRARLLEAYGYGDWQFGDESALDVRLGKHLVAWGESLFFPGITSAQGPNDATKAFVPGVEIKDILLPTNQASFQLTMTSWLTLLGYYQFEFKPTEIFPVGDYFSPADVVGPGAQFTYGSINPAYANGCPGLFDQAGALGPRLELICNTGSINGNLAGLGGVIFNAGPYILVPRGKDILPADSGHWGSGLKWAVTSNTTLGFYFLRYANHNPNVQLNLGCAQFGTVGGQPFTTCNLNQKVPETYNVKYWDNIKMAAMSWSTVLGIFNVAGEFIYRDGIDTAVEATLSGVRSPVATRGVTHQANISAIYASNPKFLWYDEVAIVGEAAYLRVKDVDPIKAENGVIPRGNGDVLFYDKSSWGANVLTLAKSRDIIPAWDLLTQINAGAIIKGTPSVPGTFGALFGAGDTRLSISFGMQYLQNLEFDIGYNFFFGKAERRVHGTLVRANPYADRDNLTFNVKYSL